LVSQLSDILKVQPDQLPERINRLVTQLRDAEKELAGARAASLASQGGDLAKAALDIAGVSVVTTAAPTGTNGDDLRTLALDVRGRLGNERPTVVAIAASGPGGRPAVVVTTNDEARGRGLKAGQLVRVAAQTLGGGGGGKDDVAQGGGTDPSKIDEALAAVQQAVGQSEASHPSGGSGSGGENL
jgi:alanyl-tRNA synthetase